MILLDLHKLILLEMEFVPYKQFKNIKFTVVLKKINNSKNTTSKELNEVHSIII
jgi:hypothetical protein